MMSLKAVTHDPAKMFIGFEFGIFMYPYACAYWYMTTCTFPQCTDVPELNVSTHNEMAQFIYRYQSIALYRWRHILSQEMGMEPGRFLFDKLDGVQDAFQVAMVFGSSDGTNSGY